MKANDDAQLHNKSLVDILRFRGSVSSVICNNGDENHTFQANAFTVVDRLGQEVGCWTWATLLDRADKIRHAITVKIDLGNQPLQSGSGARVALVFRKSEMLDFLAAFFGCQMAGMTAVPINMIDQFEEMAYILSHTKTELALTTEPTPSPLTGTSRSDIPSPTDALPPLLPEVAYIEYTKSPNGELKGVAVSHHTILAQCYAISNSLESNPRRQMRHNSRPVMTASPVASEGGVTIQSPLTPIPLAMPPLKQQQPRPADVVLSWLEPRQQVGLIFGALLGVYRGSHTVFLHSGVTETVGLWERCAHRYGATLALGDYLGVGELIQGRFSASSSSLLSSTSSRENDSSSLEQLEAFLIDAVVIQPQLELDLASNVLAPQGVISAEQVVVPVLSLPEHGGFVLSMRDYLPFPCRQQQQLIQEGQQHHLLQDSSASETRCYYLLDREALKTNWIEVLATGQDAIDRASEMGVALASAFGYACSQATLAIVHPETTELCLPNTVGELWVDTPSIPFGFWELPKRTQSTFHALPLIDPLISSGASTVEPEVYDLIPTGFLRTGLMAGLIEGRVVVFGHREDRIQQDVHIPDASELEEGSNETAVRNDFEPRIMVTDCHYATDLVNTVLKRIVGFTSCTVFQYVINKEHVPIICAETPRYHHREDAIKLTEYIRQAMFDYHGLAPYCIAIAAPGSLPRTSRHGNPQIHPGVCRTMLESGQLALAHLWTSTDDSLLNLPVGDDVAGGIWGPDALKARESVVPVQMRTIQYSSCDYPKEVIDERTKVNLSQFQSLADLLVWRSFLSPDDIAFQTYDNDRQLLQQQEQGSGKDSLFGRGQGGAKPLTFRKFGAKVVRIAAYIEKKGGFRQGEKVILLFRTGSIEFIATLYAVWFLGLVPIPVSAPEPSTLYEDIAHLMGLLSELCYGSGTYLIGNSFTEDVIKMRPAQEQMKAYIGARQDAVVPTILNISKAPKIPKKNRRNLGRESGFLTPPKSAVHKSAPALVAVHYSTDRRRTLVNMTHAGLMAQVRTLKVQCQIQDEAPIVSCARSFVGMDLLLACAIGVYVGAPTVLIPFADFEARPQVYFQAVEYYGARDVLVDCAMAEQLLGIHKPLSSAFTTSSQSYPSPLPSPTHTSFPINLSPVHNFLIASSSRTSLQTIRALESQLCPQSATEPTLASLSSTSSLTRPGGDLERMRLNGMFGHLVNPLITTRASMDIEPVRLHISLNALRRGLVEITTELDDPSGVWVEDSGIPVCGTTVAIVNPETSEICLSHEIGEIWVSSDANVQPYLGRRADSGSDAMIGRSRFHASISPSTISNNGDGDGVDLQWRLQQQRELGSKSYARTGEVGFLWNYATPGFNGGQPTSLLFVLGAIAETFEVQGLLHFPADVEQTIEGSHPNFSPGGSIVFQAEEAVVCVVTVRQAQQHSLPSGQNLDAPATNTLQNQVLCVTRQVVDRHGFMPDAVAFVEEGVLAKTRFHEKQRGKMLSLFMSAKMQLSVVVDWYSGVSTTNGNIHSDD
ncbi:hypothetical protein EC991_004540 [Linnemannia zychae]|nr:hypothetical protein EC991_004540 [Linnemannia zychae]